MKYIYIEPEFSIFIFFLEIIQMHKDPDYYYDNQPYQKSSF